MRMLLSKNNTTPFNSGFSKYNRFVELALVAERGCEVVHGAERVGVVVAEDGLPLLQDRRLHGRCFVELALVAERVCEVVHGAERVRVFVAEDGLPLL